MNTRASISSLPSETGRYHALLHKLAIFLTLWTFFVVVIGGTVKSHEAGLSIPEPFIFHWIADWYNRPNLKWEFFHRMIVGILYIGVFANMLLTLLLDKRPALKRFSVILFLLVNIQADIGYLTVAMFAHPQTSIPHAALGQSLLAMLAMVTAMQSPAWFDSSSNSGDDNELLARLARSRLLPIALQFTIAVMFRHESKPAFMIWYLVMLGSVLVFGTIAAISKLSTSDAKKRFVLHMAWPLAVQLVFGYLIGLVTSPGVSADKVATTIVYYITGIEAGLLTVLTAMWWATSPIARSALDEAKSPRTLVQLARWNVIAVFVQLLLGAALRHDDHGKAFFEGREWVFYTHLVAHVLGASAVCYTVSLVLIRVFREYRPQRPILNPARLIMMLLGAQLLLGFAAALLKIIYVMDPDSARLYADFPQPPRVWTATAHVSVGALILLFSSVLAARSYRRFSLKNTVVQSALHEGEREVALKEASL